MEWWLFACVVALVSAPRQLLTPAVWWLFACVVALVFLRNPRSLTRVWWLFACAVALVIGKFYGMKVLFGFVVTGGFFYLFYLGATFELRKRAAAQASVTARVAEISAEHGLSFDAEHILISDLSAEDDFVAFDQQHRKLVLGTGKDKTFCRIEDFSWLRGWSHTWQSNTYSQSNGSVRTSTRHCIELQTADLNCPVLFFHVESEYDASQWIARLNLLING